MQSLDPLDSKLIDNIRQLNTQNRNSGFSSQPQLAESNTLTPSLYQFINSTTLETNATELLRFKIGTPVVVNQASVNKYFYVSAINTSTNRLRFRGATGVPLTSDPISSIIIGVGGGKPSGFPGALNFTSVSTSGDEFIGLQDSNYAMIGELVFYSFNTSAWSKNGGATATVSASLPVPGATSKLFWHSGIRVTNNGVTQGGSLLITGANYVLSKWDDTNFAATGIGAIWTTFAIFYLAEDTV